MEMSKALGVHVAKTQGKYLDIPLQWGRVSKKTYSELLEKFSNRMVGQKTKCSNVAGINALIESVLDHVLNHVMPMLKLLEGLVNKIDKQQITIP